MDRFPHANGTIVQNTRTGLQTYMAQVYGWMTCGLLLTAFVAWYAAATPAVLMFVFSSKLTFFGLIIAQLALVFVLSGMVHKLSGAMATTLFMLYSALTGLTLSSIFVVYTYSSIASTFVVTGGMFGAMSLYGYTTKRDLSKFGSMLFMALIGIVLAFCSQHLAEKHRVNVGCDLYWCGGFCWPDSLGYPETEKYWQPD